MTIQNQTIADRRYPAGLTGTADLIIGAHSWLKFDANYTPFDTGISNTLGSTHCSIIRLALREDLTNLVTVACTIRTRKCENIERGEGLLP